MSDMKPKVLLVDDVEANLVTLEALLDTLDCELIRASDGNQALKQLLKHQFAAMLLDVQMPGMDGFEVARYARANPATRDTPIIFLTAAHDTEESALRGYGSGAVDFLHKPINATVLRAKVCVFLELYVGRQKLVQEVAAHEKTLAALERANSALRHFTDAASHDLKAPVRSVRGFLNALHHEVAAQLAPSARDYLERSLRAAERMDSLLDSLLSYSRLQRSVASQRVPCTGLIDQLKNELGEELSRSGAELEAATLPEVQGDPDRVYQLFQNLVTNALKFRRSETVPHIRVTAESQAAQALFCVEDNGIGIEPTHQARIFQAFFRSDTQGKFKGSGLGLAICQQVVEQHRGRIWVESRVGEGSRFYFTLPLA
ncbi:MAG TPA: ATP-binding protein [Polyangiales bacterium]|nr:ATP-binding protein [Polyangiales bacterium]